MRSIRREVLASLSHGGAGKPVDPISVLLQEHGMAHPI